MRVDRHSGATSLSKASPSADDFDEPSKIVALRIAYYMGECFVRNFADLIWSVGKADTEEYPSGIGVSRRR
jgi:hypothetical protein